MEDELISRTFTTRQASKLARMSERTVLRWAQSFIRPEQTGGVGRGKGHRWSFRDLVALRAASKLREDGASLQALKAAVAYLCETEDLEQPLAQALLVSDGGDLVRILPGQRALSLKKSKGQVTMLRIKPLLSSLKREMREEIEREERDRQGAAQWRRERPEDGEANTG